MSSLYPITIQFTCGHQAGTWTTDKTAGKAGVVHADHRCDVCSGRLRRIMKANTDKTCKTRGL